MPENKQLRNARSAALVIEARAGLIPASDHIADEIHARKDRTARIDRTVKAYAKLPACGSDYRAITDILADLRHYCDTVGLNFRELDAAAYQQYEDEAADTSMSNHA
ncbi:MAG: hypothetical protein ACR2JB_13875 [Bryobacteraceae bacterium]